MSLVDLFDLALVRASDVDFAWTLVVTGCSCYPSFVAFVDVNVVDAYLVLTLKGSLENFVAEVVFHCVVAVIQVAAAVVVGVDGLEGNFDLKQ